MIYFQLAITAIVAALGVATLYVLYLAATGQGKIIPSASRVRVGNILIFIGSGVMLFSGTLKFAHVPMVVEEMTSLSLGGWKLNVVAALELCTGLLFLLQPLRSIGLLVASAYLGAGICAHLAADQYFAMLPTMMVLGFCWLGAALRHPQILWSLTERAPDQPGALRKLFSLRRAQPVGR